MNYELFTVFRVGNMPSNLSLSDILRKSVMSDVCISNYHAIVGTCRVVASTIIDTPHTSLL
jgi:hypothetical protein